jgi:hypothetical protein
MELHPRLALVDTLLEEAEHKRTALTHAVNAQERVQQGQESTHGAPLTLEEQQLKAEEGAWLPRDVQLPHISAHPSSKTLCI